MRRAETLDGVPGVVAWAEEQSRAGFWVVLVLAYEAAPAFDSALVAHPPQEGLPLAWAASHAGPWPLPEASAAAPQGAPTADPARTRQPGHALGPWRALVPPQDYAANFARLKRDIADGETYQANYTVPFECGFSPGPESSLMDADRVWFAELARAQAAGFCAWLDLGRHRVLSLSPELFFSVETGLDGREVLARPMKGTAPRGATPQQDAALRAELGQSPKNRAENVMIVDLLRSDLGRVARPGSVRAPRLFHVEAYPTLFQMTSDVRATLRQGVGLAEVLAALFPCGSVTGAPKVRTMQLLRELEPHPRGIYCGAIGLLEPGGPSSEGRMAFSVPIRTLVLDRDLGLARFGVGGGVTFDSGAASEYAECLTKMRFLLPPERDFALLESLLLLRGRYPLLERHLARLSRSAAHFGFALDEAELRQTLAVLARAHPTGRLKARLTCARDGALAAEAAPISGSRGAGGRQPRLRVGFAHGSVDAADELLGHKTTRRELFARALDSCPGCDDALLVNGRGEVTESTRANLVLLLDGELVTPPLSSGLLPGVFRERLLRNGSVREQTLFPIDVLRAERVWLVNSVRWWMACEVACEVAAEGAAEGAAEAYL
ncbi:MAG: chorismate-binding protein [Humidesulfovibrio sp.]|nr:chorismate-binding protein [Humidesulfovibrio sp.]